MAAGNAEGVVTVWDFATGADAEPRRLRGHMSSVRSVGWSPDGTRLLTAGDDRTVRIWDTDTWDELLCLRDHASQVVCVSFSPDGLRIATVTVLARLRFWDASSGFALAHQSR